MTGRLFSLFLIISVWNRCFGDGVGVDWSINASETNRPHAENYPVSLSLSTLMKAAATRIRTLSPSKKTR